MIPETKNVLDCGISLVDEVLHCVAQDHGLVAHCGLEHALAYAVNLARTLNISHRLTKSCPISGCPADITYSASPTAPRVEYEALDLAAALPLARAIERCFEDALSILPDFHVLDPARALVKDLSDQLASLASRGLGENQANAKDLSTADANMAAMAQKFIAGMVLLLPAAYRSRYREELYAELHDLAEAKATRAMQVLYVFQQLRRVWQFRAALQAPDRPYFHRLYRLACWILTSEWRTWGLLGPLMAFAVVNVHLSQGWGSAFFTLPGVVAFYAGVEWLRKRWGVTVKTWKRSGGG